MEIDRIKEVIKERRRQGNKVAFCHGCFDALHEGHFALLRKAGATADIVVVGIENDYYVQRMKGSHRPHFPLKKRAADLLKSGLVDYIFTVPASENTRIYRQLYLELKPDFLVTANDEILEKKELDAKAVGIKVILIEKSHHASRNHRTTN